MTEHSECPRGNRWCVNHLAAGADKDMYDGAEVCLGDPTEVFPIAVMAYSIAEVCIAVDGVTFTPENVFDLATALLNTLAAIEKCPLGTPDCTRHEFSADGSSVCRSNVEGPVADRLDHLLSALKAVSKPALVPLAGVVAQGHPGRAPLTDVGEDGEGCPDWCDAAGTHLWDEEVATGRQVRIHSTLVGESVEVIADERAGEPVGQPRIWVSDSEDARLSSDTGRRLAADLLRAADLVDVLAGSAPGS